MARRDLISKIAMLAVSATIILAFSLYTYVLKNKTVDRFFGCEGAEHAAHIIALEKWATEFGYEAPPWSFTACTNLHDGR